MFSRLSQYSRKFKFKPWLLAIIFGGLVLLGAFMMYGRIRDLVVSQGIYSETGVVEPLIIFPTITPIPVPAQYFDVTSPLQPENAPPPHPWDGTSPVNILLLASDQPLEGSIIPNIDALLLVRLEPQTRSAGVIAIPPDLWAATPAGTYQPLYQLLQGRLTGDYPGGNIGFAVATLENLFDLSIPYYALVDFAAVEKVISAVEGVKINVETSQTVESPGQQNTKNLEPGIHTLPGDIALGYLRAPETLVASPDRIARQQQIIFGIRKRIIDFQLFPQLMASAPEIYTEIITGFHTNLNLQQVVQFSWLITQIPEDKIRWERIKSEQMTITADTQGNFIRQPISAEIFKLRDQVLLTQAPLEPIDVNDPQAINPVEIEAARIEIRNGTQTPGLGAITEAFLRENGIFIAAVANADQLYPATTLIFYSGKPYTVDNLVDLLQISPNNVYQRFETAAEMDILVLLGEDWAAQQD